VKSRKIPSACSGANSPGPPRSPAASPASASQASGTEGEDFRCAPAAATKRKRVDVASAGKSRPSQVVRRPRSVRLLLGRMRSCARGDRRDPLVAEAGAPRRQPCCRTISGRPRDGFLPRGVARSFRRATPSCWSALPRGRHERRGGAIERTPDVLSRRKAGARVGWQGPRRRA
jgi:hypothetical protein